MPWQLKLNRWYPVCSLGCVVLSVLPAVADLIWRPERPCDRHQRLRGHGTVEVPDWLDCPVSWEQGEATTYLGLWWTSLHKILHGPPYHRLRLLDCLTGGEKDPVKAETKPRTSSPPRSQTAGIVWTICYPSTPPTLPRYPRKKSIATWDPETSSLSGLKFRLARG